TPVLPHPILTPPPKICINVIRVKFPTLYKGVDLGDMSPHKVVDVEHCHIATDGINEALPAARKQAISRVQDVYNSDKTARVGRRGSTLLFRET
ncbi:unnamed protein product, partial [Choristocarpus tenellus]